jgi:hypothetical protein
MGEALKEILRARRRGALVYARLQHKQGGPVWHNLCQKFVRTALGAGPGSPSAKAAWQSLPQKRRRDTHTPTRKPPAGVPVYFRMNTPYWHAALSAGRGYIWSTDILRPGRVDKVSIRYLERRWNAEYVGWATHINGRRVW